MADHDFPALMKKMKKACEAQDVAGIARLAEAGLDVNHPMENGGSLLAFACKLKTSAAAMKLVELGADILSLDGSGKSALQIAAARNWIDVVEALMGKASAYRGRTSEYQKATWLLCQQAALLASAEAGAKGARQILETRFGQAEALNDGIDYAKAAGRFVETYCLRDRPGSDPELLGLRFHVKDCADFISKQNWHLLSRLKGSIPMFNLCDPNDDRQAIFDKAVSEGKIEIFHRSKLSPEERRLAFLATGSWITVALEDDDDPGHFQWLKELADKPGRSEVELCASMRPLLDRQCALVFKGMLDGAFDGTEARAEASRVAMGEPESSIERAAELQASRHRDVYERALKSFAASGLNAHLDLERGLAISERVSRAWAFKVKALGYLWGSRRLVSVDRELAEQFSRIDIPRDKDTGESLAWEMAKRAKHTALGLSFQAEHPLSPEYDTHLHYAVAVASEASGNVVVRFHCAMDPVLGYPYAFECRLRPGYSEDDFKADVLRGIDESLFAEHGVGLLASSTYAPGAEKRRSETALAQGYIAMASPDQLEAMEKPMRLAKTALNAFCYSCCAPPLPSRQPQSGGADAFSDLVKRAASGMGASSPQVGWDALWLGVKFGDYARAHRRDSQDGEAGSGPKRAVRPHPRVGYWSNRWTGPRAGTQTLTPTFVRPTFVGAKSELDIESHRPAGIRA